MDKVDQNRLWNLWYHYTYHKYCEKRHIWVVRSDDMCYCCDPDRPKCYTVGGVHDKETILNRGS